MLAVWLTGPETEKQQFPLVTCGLGVASIVNITIIC
jgi:hypothetical protein